MVRRRLTVASRGSQGAGTRRRGVESGSGGDVANPFPVLRWVWLAFFAVWAPTYWIYWKPTDFLYLCNLAVILTCAGLWLPSRLLLSSQAVGMAVIGTLWTLDVACGAAMHGHLLIGGTEYMWDANYPLWLRLLSFDHLAVPLATLWAVRKVGYDRRAWIFQSGLAALVLVASRFVAPGLDLNFAHRELLTYHTWGPPPVHLLVIWSVLVLVVYWPVHAVLCRMTRAGGDR